MTNTKIIVLKKKIDKKEAEQIIDSKKTKAFSSLLKQVKKNDIHVHSLQLYYECHLLISGRYAVDYYRAATHTISVDSNVTDVMINNQIFPTRKKSKLNKIISTRTKNKIDLQLEEHTFLQKKNQLLLDHHGNEITIKFKINSDSVERYPKRILNKQKIKNLEFTHEEAISKLQDTFNLVESDVRNVNDEFVLEEMTELYLPVFEARLVGTNKKTKILRLDAARNKII